MASLQDELRKKHPFGSAHQEAALAIARTADRVGLAFERLFRKHGLTTSQYNVLRILRGEGKPLPILEIASRTVAVVPGITGLIDRLEKAHLVERIRCEKDRRIIYAGITPQGLEKLAALDEPVLGLHGRQMGTLSQDDIKTLVALLAKVRRGAVETE